MALGFGGADLWVAHPINYSHVRVIPFRAALPQECGKDREPECDGSVLREFGKYLRATRLRFLSRRTARE